MKAGIIAAGEGSRLKSEGIATPKPLIPVGGVPLIERLLRSFTRCGISEVVCIINEDSLQVKQFVEECRLSLPVRFVTKTTPSSMHSLFELSPHLTDDRFLLTTVDSIFDEEEFSRFIGHSRQRTSADGVLAVTNYVDDENPLYAHINASNQIVEFSDRGSGTTSSWVTGGLYVFSPAIFREIGTMLDQGAMRLRHFLSHLVRSGYTLEAFPFSKIVDVDHLQDIQAAETLLRSIS
ncbi:MAG TPA: NTP transferase domain-containing protein [Bacteroidota bacterium]|jgi:NDP-sugar pyrophosphorylase family protein|nr:NTP transferase domain-containing protein [Bacteroidota bacterium]